MSAPIQTEILMTVAWVLAFVYVIFAVLPA